MTRAQRILVDLVAAVFLAYVSYTGGQTTERNSWRESCNAGKTIELWLSSSRVEAYDCRRKAP